VILLPQYLEQPTQVAAVGVVLPLKPLALAVAVS
jgi:hypothetical protein